MIELLERKLIELTPELARHYLEYNEYPAQRDIRKGWVNYLAECQRKGKFRFGEVAFAVHRNDNSKDLMMNGQHICHMVDQTNRDITCVLERYYVDTDLDKSELFTMFEIMGRSIADFVRAERIASRKHDWSNRFASLIVSAAAIDVGNNKRFLGTTGMNKSHGTWLTKDKKAQLFRSYLQEGQFVRDVFTSGLNTSSDRPVEVKHLARAPVVYVMFKTWKKHSEKARIFWIRVRDGENLTKNMPEKLLREFLMRSAARTMTHVPQKVTNHEFVCRSIIAWNNFREGNELNHLKYYPAKNAQRVK